MELSQSTQVLRSDDYGTVPTGFAAKRTSESGIFECMADPSLPFEAGFKRYTTTQRLTNDRTYAGATRSERNASETNLPKHNDP